jgi:hypothetical protein
MPTRNCSTGVCAPQRTEGDVKPALKGLFLLVSLKGPGLFLGAEVTKNGGASSLTVIGLNIDGQDVVSISYEQAALSGFTQQNPYGLVLLRSGAEENLTIGFPSPLRFQKSLQVFADIKDVGVPRIFASVVHGK